MGDRSEIFCGVRIWDDGKMEGEEKVVIIDGREGKQVWWRYLNVHTGVAGLESTWRKGRDERRGRRRRKKGRKGERHTSKRILE